MLQIGRVSVSNWLKDCLNDHDSSEAVEVFDMSKDSLVDSGRLESLKQHHWDCLQFHR